MLDLHALAISVFRLVVWLAILAAIFVPLERLFDVHPQKVFRKEWLTGLIYYFLSSPTSSPARGPPSSWLPPRGCWRGRPIAASRPSSIRPPRPAALGPGDAGPRGGRDGLPLGTPPQP